MITNMDSHFRNMHEITYALYPLTPTLSLERE
jgi:hypothetical protein